MASDKRIEFLKNKFPGIENESFDKIIDADPTTEKKYSDWLLKLFSKSTLQLNELSILTEAIKTYSELKESLPIELRDINKFNSAILFIFSLNKWLVSRFQENEKFTTFLKKGAELLLDNENVQIVKILSHEGSINFGSNTSWCTLQADTYHQYSSKGFLHIVIPKNKNYSNFFGTKTQLHLATSEYRNNKNEEVDLITCICKFPELYDPFKEMFKNSESNKHDFLYYLLHIEESSVFQISLIEKYGYDVLKFVKDFTRDLVENLFSQFGQEAYEFIPDSPFKNVAFICSFEAGLKTLLKEGRIEITENDFKESVLNFPENILLMDCDDEELWSQIILEEPWLVKKSPFKNNSEKLFELVDKKLEILKYIVPHKIFNEKQKETIALLILDNPLDDYCESVLPYLLLLGELSEETQIKLINKNPDCFSHIEKISPTAKALSDKLIAKRKAKEEKEQAKKDKEIENNKSAYIANIANEYFSKRYSDNYKYGYSDYERKASYHKIEKVIQDADGTQYYVTNDGQYFRSYNDIIDYCKKKDNGYGDDFYNDISNDVDLNPF